MSHKWRKLTYNCDMHPFMKKESAHSVMVFVSVANSNEKHQIASRQGVLFCLTDFKCSRRITLS